MDTLATPTPGVGRSSDAGSSSVSSAVKGDLKRAATFKQLSPQDWAATISAHAHRTIETSLYPGPHFERLASYLQQAFRVPTARNTAAVTGNTVNQPFVFVYHYLQSGTSRGAPLELSKPQQVLEPPTIPASAGARGSLIFMRGLPSSQWLVNLGGMYRIDPEYLQRHLDFFSTMGRINYYPPTSLPSSSSYIIQLRYFTVAKPEIVKLKSPEEIHARRAGAKTDMTTYLTGLSSRIERDQDIGGSIVRNFWTFHSGHVAIEQAMTLCVIRDREGGNWTGMAWIDTGKDLGELSGGPWFRSNPAETAYTLDQRTFLPTIQIRPWAALRSHGREHEVARAKRPPPKYAQSSALVHLDYGRTLDTELMSTDAFYAFHELFAFCASSHAQFLDLVEQNISEEVPTDASPEALSLAQSNYTYMQELLEGQISRLHGNLDAIKVRGGPSWPRNEIPGQLAKGKSAAEVLRKDYEWLLHRAQVLANRCKSKISHLTTQAMLAESKKAIQQAQEVAKLTQLAFVFVPLSFTSSVFGMNVNPLVKEDCPLWMWIVVSFPLLVLSLLIMKWDIRGVLRKLQGKIQGNDGR